MDITLKQASLYELVIPLTLNGAVITETDVQDMLFTIINDREELVRLTLADGLSFITEGLRVSLNSAVSTELRGTYYFELWMKDPLGEPIYMDGGKITFEKTRARF